MQGQCPTGPLIWNNCGGLTGKSMNVPKVDIKQLLEAGVHLGHKTLSESKNEKIHFWGKKIYSYYRFNSNS